jgi:pimeloyl-ACP methyl ester carboxylesterase
MASDVRGLADHLGLLRVDVMGYSMGARIAAFLTLANPTLVRSVIFGGLGHHLVDGVGLPLHIAEAMEAPSLADLSDPRQRQFRAFAEQTGSDLKALANCIRGSRQTLTAAQVAQIDCPALVAIGTKDEIAGNPHQLAAMMPRGRALEIPNRDHQLTVGDKLYKQGVLEFLSALR